MDYSVKDFYVPTITYFTSENKLTGSRNGMNYKFTPDKKEGTLLLQVWYGEFNLEHSELVDQTTIIMETLEKEGMGAVEQWLYQQYDRYASTAQAAAYLKKQKKREV